MRIAIAIVLIGGIVAAQTPSVPAAPTAFEVASIKQNTSGAPSSSSSTRPNGTYVGTNVPLRQVILNAYRLRPFQLIGGPDWIQSDRFDINAKAVDGLTTAQVQAAMPVMIRSLLADRFKLRAHTETREQPIYAVVLARSDGRLGPQLTRSTAECSPGSPPQGRAGASGAGSGAAGPPPPGERPVCGLNTSINNIIGTMRGGGRTIAELLPSLGNVLDRVVVDRTGLTGTFDVDLKWSAEALGSGAPNQQAPADAPSIFTALQEQLGLKLESTRGPVEVLVIDSIEPPTAD
jgi:uncharacterized protein (TIGR03435 family)